MEFREIITRRYSVRSYRPDPVEDEKLNQVLDAARLAPTAANRQPFSFIVMHTDGRQADLRRIYQREWFTQPPLLICACGIRSLAWTRRDGRSYLDVDIAIAVDHLTLAAADLGLGTCWVASFDESAVRQVFGLPREVEPVILIPLGYPADEPPLKERKPLTDLVRFEHW